MQKQIIIISLVLFLGCATSKWQTYENNNKLVDPTKAKIVLTRKTSPLGAAILFNVYDGDRYIGQLGPGGTLTWYNNSGKLNMRIPKPHLIYGLGFWKYPRVDIPVNPNQIYTFRINPFGKIDQKVNTTTPTTNTKLTQQLPPLNQSTMVRIPVLGTQLYQINNETVQIVKVWDFASKQGIKRGDIIKSIDGFSINHRYDVLKTLRFKEVNDIVSLELSRNNNLITIEYVIEQFQDLPKSIYEVAKLLYKDERINLAIILGEFTNLLLDDPTEWTKGAKSKTVNEIESQFLMHFGEHEEKFSMIDRQIIEDIINEMKFQSSGLVSQSSAIEIGEMTAATHVIIVSLARNPSGNGYVDSYSRRLIDVETGSVLSSVIEQIPISSNR